MAIFNRSITLKFSKKDVDGKTAGQLFKNPAVFCISNPNKVSK